MERKLVAILSADVEGYGRLMGDDEAATVRTITEYREVIASTVTGRGGRVVDAPGDNVLAEFPSVVDAVQGAVEIQRELGSRNADLPLARQMRFRIGINLGDVIVERERLYGDGVNIAARLESLADGGGICLSGTAYDQIEWCSLEPAAGLAGAGSGRPSPPGSRCPTSRRWPSCRSRT